MHAIYIYIYATYLFMSIFLGMVRLKRHSKRPTKNAADGDGRQESQHRLYGDFQAAGVENDMNMDRYTYIYIYIDIDDRQQIYRTYIGIDMIGKQKFMQIENDM